MYVWHSTTGALEQSSGVFSAGYNNGSSGNQCAVIDDAQNFEKALNGCIYKIINVHIFVTVKSTGRFNYELHNAFNCIFLQHYS